MVMIIIIIHTMILIIIIIITTISSILMIITITTTPPTTIYIHLTLLLARQGWPGDPLVNPGATPIDRTFDLHVHAITQIEQLVRPGRQRLAAEGARPVHTFLPQFLDARLAVLVAARKLELRQRVRREERCQTMHLKSTCDRITTLDNNQTNAP